MSLNDRVATQIPRKQRTGVTAWGKPLLRTHEPHPRLCIASWTHAGQIASAICSTTQGCIGIRFVVPLATVTLRVHIPIHVCVLRRASVPSPERACARCVLDHHRTCVASTGVMSHPAFQFYYRNVLLFFNRKTVSGPPSCARSPCRQWSPEHGRLDNVFGQHPSLHKERSAINRSLGILKALYTVIMSTNIILLPGAVRQHNDRLCLTVRCC